MTFYQVGHLGTRYDMVIKAKWYQTLLLLLVGCIAMAQPDFVTNSVSNPFYFSDSRQSHVEVVANQSTEADLSVYIESDHGQIFQGNVFEVEVSVLNNGPDTAEIVALEMMFTGIIENVIPINSEVWQCNSSNPNHVFCYLGSDLQLNSTKSLFLRVESKQVVQTTQPISIVTTVYSETYDPQLGNNQANLMIEVEPTPTEDQFLTHVQHVIGSIDQQTQRAIRNVASYCAGSYFTAMESGMCDLIWNADEEDRADLRDMMREITPNEVLGQSNSAAEIITSQFRNIDARLSELRAGGGGFSLSGLRATYGNQSIPLAMLAYLNAEEPDNTVNNFVSPWSFFINGTISMGERDKTGRELGFDFDTYGITAGLDYRLNSQQVIGMALGYAHFDSQIEDEAEMKSNGITLTGYGSFYLKDNFYLDARISYGQPRFEQTRRINFSIEDVTIDRTAHGDTDASQYTVAFNMGYHFNKNGWNMTPNFSFRYVDTQINQFTESGAGGFNFSYAEQHIKSMVGSLGFNISKAISLKKGVITPQFDINLSRELENNGGLVEAWFINAPDDEIFWIETDEPDRLYGDAGLGLVFIGANGKQAYINYRSMFGLDGFSRGTINLGLRFEF